MNLQPTRRAVALLFPAFVPAGDRHSRSGSTLPSLTAPRQQTKRLTVFHSIVFQQPLKSHFYGGRALAVFGVLAIFALGVSTNADEAEANLVPEKIDLSAFPGVMVEKVVVPIPAEIFAVLEKLDEPNWRGVIQMPDADRSSSDRAILALSFGSLVGEGFVAVQAKAPDEIEKIGRRVLSLADSLGLSRAVQPHSLSIVEAANAKDWDAVREELDATQQTVKTTMEELRDDELSGLVSLGGWIRGTHVVTSLVSDSFSADKAELLNQPDLISHFREMLEILPDGSSASPQIRAISTGLARLEAIVSEDEDISEEDVRELKSITQSLLEQYYFESVQP